jgi:hypothetical protein
MSQYTKNTKCRICGNKNLIPVIDLKEQYLTGIFPSSATEKITKGPLILEKCHGIDSCGLLQMAHSYSLDEMYGMNYGYRSGLNNSMVKHLQDIVQRVSRLVSFEENDCVIDIGSNDSTLLSFYSKEKNLKLLGVDPSGEKFKTYYPDHVQLISDFFPSQKLNQVLNGKKAKVITSIAMFYDLEDPMAFVGQIKDHLHKDGVWVFEQSYMPTMLDELLYDTICQEHIEYYGLHQIKFMTDKAGFKIIDIEFNDINGGSFLVVAAPKESEKFVEQSDLINKILDEEKLKNLLEIEPYLEFQKRIVKQKDDLRVLLKQLKDDGKKVIGYGASTKGNVILQFCEIDKNLLPCVAEVNPDKFGKFTPGTNIPIISEQDARQMKPDYFLVLPWHFKDFIQKKEADFIKATGTKFIYPLPELHIV